MYQRFYNFVDFYLSEINHIISEKIHDKNYTTEQASNEIIDKRRKIPLYLDNYGLPEDYLSDTQNKELLVEQIKKGINIVYNQDLFEQINQDEFIETLFFNNTEITFKDINKYGKKLKQYNADKNINNFYKLAFTDFDSERLVQEGERLEFQQALCDTFHLVKESDKAEFFAKFNVFFEEYLKTDIGSKRLELMFKKYAETEDKTIAIDNWTRDLINIVNQSTPNKSDLALDDNGKLVRGTKEAGLFDALYFIKKVDLNKQQQNELSEIQTTKDLIKFERQFDSIIQIQISATSDKGIDIEGESVFRHSLANTVISTTLNNYWKSSRDDNFINAFTKTNQADVKSNFDIQQGIITAFRQEHPKLVQKLDKGQDPETLFVAIQKDLTANPEKYIANKLDVDLQQRDIKKLNKFDIEQYLSFNDDEFYERSIFEPKSYFAIYYEYGINAKMKNITEVESNPLNEASMPEIAIAIQYSGIIKQSILEELDIDLEALHHYFESSFELRGIARNFEVDNERLNELSIDQIDEFVLHNFILSEHSVDNNYFLDRKRTQNFTKIVQGLLRDHFNSQTSEDLTEKDILNGLLLLKHQNCFFRDSELDIFRVVESDLEVHEKQLENEILPQYDGIISEISFYNKKDIPMKECSIEYKLNTLIEEQGKDVNSLKNNLSNIKEFLEDLQIDWRNQSIQESIDSIYIDPNIFGQHVELDKTQSREVNISENQSFEKTNGIIIDKFDRHTSKQMRNKSKENKKENKANRKYNK